MSSCEYLSYEYLQYMQYLQISEMYTIPNPGLESSWSSFNTSDPAVCVLAYSGTTEAQSALVFLLNGINSFRKVDWSVFYCLHWTWYAATPWHLHEKCLSFQWSCTVHKQTECDPPEHVSLNIMLNIGTKCWTSSIYFAVNVVQLKQLRNKTLIAKIVIFFICILVTC